MRGTDSFINGTFNKENITSKNRRNTEIPNVNFNIDKFESLNVVNSNSNIQTTNLYRKISNELTHIEEKSKKNLNSCINKNKENSIEMKMFSNIFKSQRVEDDFSSKSFLNNVLNSPDRRVKSYIEQTKELLVNKTKDKKSTKIGSFKKSKKNYSLSN